MSFSQIVGRKNQQDNTKRNDLGKYSCNLPTTRSNKHPGSFSSLPLTIKKDKNETEEQKKIRLLSELGKCENPFSWKPKDVKPFNEPETIIHRIQEKGREVQDERVFKWRKFIFKIIISYELWRAKKLSQAFEEICELESLLYSESNHRDFLFSHIEHALFHVVKSSKAFLYSEQDKLTEAEQLMNSFLPYKFKKKEQAGIHGIMAAMFMEYGHMGNELALQEAKKAVELDRICAEWFFYISKCMGRIRRVARCHEVVDKEEVWNINQAIDLDQRNVTYKVFLAQVLSEKAHREYKITRPEKKSKEYKKIMKINCAAKFTFQEAAELSPNSSHILIRCAKGLMKLPPSIKDLKLINECVVRARQLAPNNPMVLHVQAMYHERYDCDVELSLEAYEKAASLGNFGASMDLVRLHHKLKTSDIIEELEIIATNVQQSDKLQVVYTQAGSYLLFIKKDIIGALKYYLKVIDIDPHSYAMKSHKPIFLRLRTPVNMFDVLLEELATRTEWNSFSSEERQVLKLFKIRAGTEHESLPNDENKRLTVQEILDMSKGILKHDDLYEHKRAYRNPGNTSRNIVLRKWFSKRKKNSKKDTVEKISVTENLSLKPEIGTQKNTKTVINKKSRDRTSSSSSVDSDYQRDSTVFGSRDFFLRGSNQSLNQGVDPFRESSEVWRDRKSDRSCSVSSLSSVSTCGSMDFSRFENINLSGTDIRKLSTPTLSGASSGSQISRRSSKAIWNSVKQSYEMLNQRKKETHGSTQSLNAIQPTDQKRRLENRNIAKSESSQSLTALEVNPKGSFTKNLAPRFKSKDSNLGSSKSLSFLPNYARKSS